jgi:hypothetical protein
MRVGDIARVATAETDPNRLGPLLIEWIDLTRLDEPGQRSRSGSSPPSLRKHTGRDDDSATENRGAAQDRDQLPVTPLRSD